MIPPQNDPRWKDLLTGKTQHQFKRAAVAMCVARNQRLVQEDASSAAMESGLGDLHSFFVKYEQILGEDLQALFG